MYAIAYILGKAFHRLNFHSLHLKSQKLCTSIIWCYTVCVRPTDHLYSLGCLTELVAKIRGLCCRCIGRGDAYDADAENPENEDDSKEGLEIEV